MTKHMLTTGVFDPKSLPGLKVWLKARALVGADNDPVSTWTDSSGGGHDFTAAGGARPTLQTVSGRRTVRFDGTDDRIVGGDLSALFPTAATLYVVYSAGSTPHNIYITKTTDTRWRHDDGAGYTGVFRAVRIAAYPAVVPAHGTGFHYYVIKSDATAYTHYIDGVGQTPQAAGHNGGDGHEIGRDASNVVFGSKDVSEVLIYDTAHSDLNRVAVQNYLKLTHGL